MFGSQYLIDVLMGKENERIRRFGHDRTSVFGTGKDLSLAEWKSVFRQLVAQGLLSVSIEDKGGFKLTPASRPVLKGEQGFELRKDPVPVRSKARKTAGKGAASAGKERSGAAPGSFRNEVFEKLRALRLRIAKEQGVPPYVIFHDKTLWELIEVCPRSLEEMKDVSGIGGKKIEQYGDRSGKRRKNPRQHRHRLRGPLPPGERCLPSGTGSDPQREFAAPIRFPVLDG